MKAKKLIEQLQNSINYLKYMTNEENPDIVINSQHAIESMHMSTWADIHTNQVEIYIVESKIKKEEDKSCGA